MGNEQRPNGPTIVSTDFFIKTSPGNETPKNRLAKKVLAYVPPSLALLLATTACGAQISTINPTETTIITDPPAITEPLPEQTATPEIVTTPTVEINRNYPSPFADLYFGSYTENGQTKIISGISGDLFESQNPGCNIPDIDGGKSQHNTLYNPNLASDLPVGFMVPESYLTKIFGAVSSKDGTKGTYQGNPVEFINNVWQMQKDEKTLFLNPVVPSLSGRDFGYPVVCEKNGQLMMGLAFENGTIVDNTLQPAFQSAEQIAKNYGYTDIGKAASVGIMKDGRLEVKDTNGNTLAYLQFLGKSETKIFPSIPEGVNAMTVYNYETGKDETLSPTFDEEMDTYVWKNQKGEIRRFLDKETGHIFSQTEHVEDRLIYQIDTYFGWEADLTQVDPNFDPTYERIGHQYLRMIDETYPGVLTGFDDNTKVVFKIGQDNFDNVIKKSGISLSSAVSREVYFWPVYDKNHNTYAFATYVEKDSTNDIDIYTKYVLNFCPTSQPYPYGGPSTIGTIGGEILKKPIQ